MNNNRGAGNPPAPHTPNVIDYSLLDEVLGLTVNDLPPDADAFLEPFDEPLPNEHHVYVVWRGRVPGLYYRW